MLHVHGHGLVARAYAHTTGGDTRVTRATCGIGLDCHTRNAKAPHIFARGGGWPYRYCYLKFNISCIRGARERPMRASMAAMQSAAIINKVYTPCPVQHLRSLRGHPHGYAKGPWGARGRLPVTKRWPWTSRRPIPVQRRVMCCILAQETMEWHQVGSWGPSFVSPNPLETLVWQWIQADT